MGQLDISMLKDVCACPPCRRFVTTYWTCSSIDDVVKRKGLRDTMGTTRSRRDGFGFVTLPAVNGGTGGDVGRPSIRDRVYHSQRASTRGDIARSAENNQRGKGQRPIDLVRARWDGV